MAAPLTREMILYRPGDAPIHIRPNGAEYILPPELFASERGRALLREFAK